MQGLESAVGIDLLSVIRSSGVSVVEGFRTYGSLWETLSVISQVSAVEGCPLGGVPLYPNQELGVRAVEPVTQQ